MAVVVGVAVARRRLAGAHGCALLDELFQRVRDRPGGPAERVPDFGRAVLSRVLGQPVLDPPAQHPRAQPRRARPVPRQRTVSGRGWPRTRLVARLVLGHGLPVAAALVAAVPVAAVLVAAVLV